MQKNSASPQVKFIMELNYSSREQKNKLAPLYDDKFLKVLRAAKSKRYFAMDYAALAPIRRLVSAHPDVGSLVPYIKSEVGEEGLVTLLGMAPLFDMAPPDLKAYILMSMGLRNCPSTAARP